MLSLLLPVNTVGREAKWLIFKPLKESRSGFAQSSLSRATTEVALTKGKRVDITGDMPFLLRATTVVTLTPKDPVMITGM